MSANNPSETFVGFAALILMSSLLCAPILGWSGLVGGLAAIYFGLVLTNGADTAAKRNKNKRR